MVKNASRHLLVLVLCFSISFSICGCFWGVKFSTREELEPKVIEYIQEKYDFTPQINDEIVFLDYFGSIHVKDLDYIYGKSAKETNLGGYSVYGEYAGFKINGINSDLYFSVKSHKK